MDLPFSSEEYGHRAERLIEHMAAENLDAILLFAPESMYWLTGYDTFGFCFFQCLVFKADGSMSLLTRAPDLRQAKRTSIIKDIHIWMERTDSGPVHQLLDLLDAIGLLGAKIGVEYDTQGLTAYHGKQLDDRLKTFAELSDQSGLVPTLRSVKSFAEISYVREAAERADLALSEGLKEIKPGNSESDVLAAMQGSVFREGGGYPGNGFIVGSGEDALLCRTKSGRNVIEQTDQVTLEWAGTARNYHAAMMRTIVVGEPSDRQAELFKAALAALRACEEVLRPGHTFGDVFEAHASVLDEAGLHSSRLNACGYSLGARFAPSWMDTPMFYRHNDAPINSKMSLFVHIILFDDLSGTAMTLGQTYLTTDSDPEPLSKFPLELLCV